MRYLKYVLGGLVVSGLVVMTVGFALAAGSTQQFTIGNDLFIAGDSVVVDTPVTGDVYAAGNSVRIKANVAGDVLVAGKSVTIDGSVGGALRGAGETVNINGSVAGLILVGGMNVNLNKGEGATASHLIIGGQTVVVNRPVTGDVVIGAAALDLDSTVGGNARLGVAALTKTEASKIAGTAIYYADGRDEVVFQAIDMITDGQVTYTPATKYQGSGYAGLYQSAVWSTILLTVTVVLFGLLTNLFFPRATTRLVTIQRRQSGLVILIGIIAIPVIFFISSLLLVTGVFSLLTLLLLTLLPAAVALGMAGVYQNLGQIILPPRDRRRGWALAVGGLAFILLYFIPVVNIIAGMIATVLAVGSITLALGQRLKLAPKRAA